VNATRDQLDEFHAFATTQLANGGADLSLEELLWKWRDFEEACENIRRGFESKADGTAMLLDEFAEEMRRKHGIGTRT
jgi:hypothetical protein